MSAIRITYMSLSAVDASSYDRVLLGILAPNTFRVNFTIVIVSMGLAVVGVVKKATIILEIKQDLEAQTDERMQITPCRLQ